MGAETTRLPAPLVQPGWLILEQGNPDLRIVDFRWYLDGEVTGSGTGMGRHPLPSPEQFQAAMRRAGVNNRSLVVVYDDLGGFSAARLWWLLRYYGHPAVSVLDGGLAAWPGQLSTDDPNVPEGDFVAAPPRSDMAVDYQALREAAEDAVLLDARAPERYRGEVEPLDPRAGHIPGARSRPWQANLDERKRFLPPERLRREFRELGVRSGAEVVAYCGSGVSACQNLLALEVAGLAGGRLYPGSWSDWSTRPAAAVAVGSEE